MSQRSKGVVVITGIQFRVKAWIDTIKPTQISSGKTSCYIFDHEILIRIDSSSHLYHFRLTQYLPDSDCYSIFERL